MQKKGYLRNVYILQLSTTFLWCFKETNRQRQLVSGEQHTYVCHGVKQMKTNKIQKKFQGCVYRLQSSISSKHFYIQLYSTDMATIFSLK